MTLSEVMDIEGEEGNFSVKIKQHPRYVDVDKCIACGECASKCPKSVLDEYNVGISKRKAIYVKYPQAVPLKYQIDPKSCIRLNKPGKCGFCEKVCPAGAIKFDDTEKELTIQVGSIIMAPGFECFDPKEAKVWGYGQYPNVITSLQFERFLSSSGPTEGHLIRPSDGKSVRKVAFLQCVGSRDKNRCSNEYCSSVCCMYAIKEAVIAKDHVPDLVTSIFFMDMRTNGKDFDRYYQRAKDESGVRFVRCRVHGVEPHGEDGDLRIHYINEEGRQIEEYYDLVVLSVGLETPKSVIELANKAGIQLTLNNFAATSAFNPVLTSRPGIFTCGAFAGPKDIPQSVMEGSAAAAGAAEVLARVRNSMTREKEFPPERDVAKEQPRIGVFVCHCGSNIASVVDVESLADYAATLPYVEHVERNLFTCSQDTQEIMKDIIQKKGLNRIVVAACTPRTHESLFRETLKAAGLNEYLFEMANIRNQDSWVHQNNPQQATQKAKDLVRMAVSKVALQGPLNQINVPITQRGLVIGGGVAGMESALSLAEQGFDVDLVEKGRELGGNARFLHQTWTNEDIQGYLQKLIQKVFDHPKINVHLESKVIDVDGYVGNYSTTIYSRGKKKTIEHGIGIIAIGGQRFRPNEYGYGKLDGVFTSIEFDAIKRAGDYRIRRAKSFVFIQCVGSREDDRNYCSRVCCTHSVQAAIDLKKEDPSRSVYILYRDMRTYGEREALYRQAREMGIIFINYELHGKPRVSPIEDSHQMKVEVWDHVLHRPLEIVTDLVVLASAIVPNPDAKNLAKLFKVPVDSDGFFQEAHAKLRPVDFATDGLFMAGLTHYPKPIEESIAQAKAAAAKAAALLARESIALEAIKANVNPQKCDGCALCIDVCPFNAISLVETRDENGDIHKSININKAQCKGCGLCQGTCPKEGVNVAGFSMEQLRAQIKAALAA
ncbi:CoB--CoM heterodisulfide reductase, subunit A [Dissulfuribacter thermophilus]|uniref:CoB--CoM heterodisulfide reductase, subunit A n=3 Tax=Dissulfuribacter thermophilus TaxID=1156395 RepID=A0A1B9F5K9_9BACT|nr:CoB--CoM heterodisulfide reductase, subunit A [Dissulfuribacter thermophilus]